MLTNSLALAVFTGWSSLVSLVAVLVSLVLLIHSILIGSVPAVLSAGFSTFPTYLSHMSTIHTYSFSSLPSNRTLLLLVHRSETTIRSPALSLTFSLCHSNLFVEQFFHLLFLTKIICPLFPTPVKHIVPKRLRVITLLHRLNTSE